ncbi:hypothetical protein A1O3_01491 [Capronia epimyces CBS 606.96]|uniref:Uncharacterized protein n=1 Tax=Capronia epimyces CBS 606.96 TaxID=1182542 RepID=W9YTF9_9EURO|nr:uncharacterized protein A1O3_01491 [Capronia epimyces CBS 606.96]EXJ92935.1 hypothetical protein A1O3_01491 [Capronia epimyces CBS 606.96]
MPRMKPMLNAIKGRTENHQKCLKLLLERGTDVNATSMSTGMTYLHYAIAQEFWPGYATTVKMLLEANADPSIVDNAGHTPLAMLIKGQSPGQVRPLGQEEREALTVLLNRNPIHQINVRNPHSRENLLHMAVRRQDAYTLEAVLGRCTYSEVRGRLVSERTPQGHTPLLLIMNICHFTTSKAAGVALRMLEVLLEHGADADDADTRRGDTALHFIIGVHRSFEALELLLRHKANALKRNTRHVCPCALLRDKAHDYPYDPWYARAIMRLCELDEASTPGPGSGQVAAILKAPRRASPEMTPPQSPTRSS